MSLIFCSFWNINNIHQLRPLSKVRETKHIDIRKHTTEQTKNRNSLNDLICATIIMKFRKKNIILEWKVRIHYYDLRRSKHMVVWHILNIYLH